MSENNSINDFTALHQAMIYEIKAKVPSVKTVVAYDPTDTENGGQRQAVKTPAVLIELAEMKPGATISGNRQTFGCEFILHCVLSVKTPNVQIEIRNYAAAVAKVVFRNRWGLSHSVENPSDISAYQGVFKPGDKGFESWVVGYTQKVHLGDVALNTDIAPSDVYIGFAPDIGPANQADYTKVTP